MSTSRKSDPYYPEPEKMCICGRRCKVATSMTLKNPMRKFVHCRNYRGGGGCDYFEWVDESLDEGVRSMVVGLIVSNDTMAAEIKRLENDLEAQKHEVAISFLINHCFEHSWLHVWLDPKGLNSYVHAIQLLHCFLSKSRAKSPLNAVLDAARVCVEQRRKTKDSGATVQNGGKE
ncbi:hypothetical protein Cgig2_024053 [Carnegiea gigantea]|uniref:GRF-type domain-containing protein n=1 Tax=Carnegiea gigantea TaxID=171969 RepID=A0A9Q1KKG8_9CARY|nr:hypothetical protein Cgig2_024053 [Carnegiea gigantea]